jgi:formyltetrahydrofolate deformylase
MRRDDHPLDLRARSAATRVLDAFYLEGRVMPESEYAPLREAMRGSAVLLLGCPDGDGHAAAVTDFFQRHDAQVVSADQHSDIGQIAMRVEWQWCSDGASPEALGRRFAELAHGLQARWQMAPQARPQVAIFVSREVHCLRDLLQHHAQGSLDCDIALIVSNHRDAQLLAEAHEIAFHQFAIGPDNKADVERAQIELLRLHRIDLVVLARYMQILSPQFVAAFPQRIINVHHSLLPAFCGAQPYREAFQRGVRYIGATSHYVTDVLDDGPIIDQEAMRMPYRARLEDFPALGRELEKKALLRAVRWHLAQRILVHDGRAIVFDGNDAAACAVLEHLPEVLSMPCPGGTSDLIGPPVQGV